MTDETQPTTFPVTVEEWARSRTRPERFLVAGFLMSIRRREGLLGKKKPEAWDDAFQAYATTPKPAVKAAKKK